MRALPIILLLAACSPRPTDKPAGTTATATPVAAVAAPADSHAAARPGTLKTFGDWTVGCDNVRTCTLASLGGEGGDFPPVTVAVTRDGTAGAAPKVELDAQQDATHDALRPAMVAIDGRVLDPANGRAVIAVMANGHVLTIRDAKGATIATQSLKGASAGLRFIDAVQGRAGGVTALVAGGLAPAGAVPMVPALPTIVAVTPSGTPVMPDKATLKALAVQAGADPVEPDPSVTADPEAYALGGGATLVLIPWSQGAYNITEAAFVMRGGKVVPASFDAPVGFGGDGRADPDPVQGVVNASFDGGVLESYVKGRGIGDCGSTQDFVWDGTRFRLSQQADMGDCRGNPDFITTWRTRVVRR